MGRPRGAASLCSGHTLTAPVSGPWRSVGVGGGELRHPVCESGGLLSLSVSERWEWGGDETSWRWRGLPWHPGWREAALASWAEGGSPGILGGGRQACARSWPGGWLCSCSSALLGPGPPTHAHRQEQRAWGSGHSLGAGGCPQGAPGTVTWQSGGPVLFASLRHFQEPQLPPGGDGVRGMPPEEGALPSLPP